MLPAFLQKAPHEKKIGVKAARTISSGDVVMLDGGTSIQSVAQFVSDVNNVTFIVNSIPIASILLEKYQFGDFTGKIIMVGGEVDCENRFTVGEPAVGQINRYYADKAFICCTSVSAEGAAQSDLGDGSYSAALIKRCSNAILVAGSEKFGNSSVVNFARLNEFSDIITDDVNAIPEDILSIIYKNQINLSVAD